MTTDLERRVLLGILAAADRLAALAERWARDPRQRPNPRAPGGLAQIVAVRDLAALGVRVDLVGWCGIGDGCAARQAAHRALRKLEARGLVVRGRAQGSYLTHAKLTEQGERVARGLPSAHALRDLGALPVAEGEGSAG